MCTIVLDFHSKNLQITSKLLTQGYRYHKLRKTLESSLDHTPNFCRNLVICKRRSTEGCSKLKSRETRQAQERLVSTLEHMQVPKWDRTRCPEDISFQEYVSKRISHQVFYGDLVYKLRRVKDTPNLNTTMEFKIHSQPYDHCC